MQVINSQLAGGAGSRLVNVSAVSSVAGPPRLATPTPAAVPGTIRAKPIVAPPPPPAALEDVQLGSLECVAGDPSELRAMIPAIFKPGVELKTVLEIENDAMRVGTVTNVGQHVVVNLHADWRMGGQFPFAIKVTGGGQTVTAKGILDVKHQKPAPFGMTCVLGTQTSAEVPYTGQLWAKATYQAHFEPVIKEFRLTAYRGTMDAGSRVFPFKVVFTPSSPKSVVTLLVVVFNNQTEYCVDICGSSAGFQGKNWGKRHRGIRMGVTSTENDGGADAEAPPE
jgi:hypothetical protein